MPFHITIITIIIMNFIIKTINYSNVSSLNAGDFIFTSYVCGVFTKRRTIFFFVFHVYMIFVESSEHYYYNSHKERANLICIAKTMRCVHARILNKRKTCRFLFARLLWIAPPRRCAKNKNWSQKRVLCVCVLHAIYSISISRQYFIN